MRRFRLGVLAGVVCGLCLVVGCTSDAVDLVGQDRVYGPQPRASAPAWPGMVGVTIGDQPSSWWPVSSARDLRPTGIEVIASSAVVGMVVDGAGAVWVDLPGGLARLDPVTWSATVWDAGDDAAFAGKGFVRASNGPGVWLVGQDRARLFDGVRFVRDIQVPSAVLGEVWQGQERIGDLLEVGSELWIARDTGVARCDGHAWSVVGEGPLHDVWRLALTPWGEVWAGTWTGSGLRWMRYDGTSWTPIDRRAATDGIAWDPAGGIVAASGREVVHFDGSQWQVLLRLDRDAGDGTVWAVAAAGDGTVWAVTGDALLRSADRVVWDTIAAPDGTQLTGVAVSGAQVVVSADTGVYRVVGGDLERVWSPGAGQAVSDDILDVVAVSGDRAWVVAADWMAEPVVFSLRELQIGRRDPVLTRSLPASVVQGLPGWSLPGLGSGVVAASDGAIWYVTDESIVRIADGTESVVARRPVEHLPGELMVNVAAGVGGPERADPRPREIGPDTVAELTVPGPTVTQTLYADGDITCPEHWAHDLSLPVGQVQYTPTPQGIEITVTLTGAWPDTQYYAEVNPDEFCRDRPSASPEIARLITDPDGAGSVTFTYTGIPTDAQQPPGVGLLAGSDGAVWVLPTARVTRWFADSESDERDEQGGWEVPCLLTPGGQCTSAELPAPAGDTRGLVVGASGHLWATVCEDGSEAGGWGDLTCPSGRQLMRWESGWLHVAYPGADIAAVGAAPDGSFWAILAQETGQFDHGTLAHYRDGAWTTFPDFATADDPYYYLPADYALTPASSVCRIDGKGPTLVCVDTSLQISRTPVDRFGQVAVADDGAVWVWDYQVLARMPITVP
jgi:hypothetical protein